MLPDPRWPVVLLAIVQAADALLVLLRPPFIVACLDGVRLPRRWWPLLVWLKAAAAAGLIAGLWVPWLGLTTSVAVVAYFVVAATMHVRSRYLGRDFWLNCLGMLAMSVAVVLVSFR